MLHTDATFRHRKSMSDKNIHQKLQGNLMFIKSFAGGNFG